MVDRTEQQASNFNNENAFRFDCGADWARMSADLSRICQMVGEQLRATLAEIDLEGLRREVKEALDNAAVDIQRANKRWRHEGVWPGPRHEHEDVSPSPEGEGAAAAERAGERMTVLRLVAQGKISAEEAARLLDALGD